MHPPSRLLYAEINITKNMTIKNNFKYFTYIKIFETTNIE